MRPWKCVECSYLYVCDSPCSRLLKSEESLVYLLYGAVSHPPKTLANCS